MREHLLNCELYGFSVIMPDEVDPTGSLPRRLLDAILRLAEEATGAVHDIETGEMGTLPVAGQSDRRKSSRRAGPEQNPDGCCFV